MGRWNTTPIAASAARGSWRSSWPQTAIPPASGENRWVISAISVVLPAPFGPRSAVNSPCGTVKPTLSKALIARV